MMNAVVHLVRMAGVVSTGTITITAHAQGAMMGCSANKVSLFKFIIYLIQVYVANI